MYEINYISAANASLNDIVETRENIVQLLLSTISDYLKIDEDKRSEEVKETIKVYQDVIDYVKNSLNVIIELDKVPNEDIKLKHIDSLLKKCSALDIPLKVYVTGFSKFGNESEHLELLFSQEQLNKLTAISNHLVQNGCYELMFMEDPRSVQDTWTLSQVVKANQEIDKIVNFIKMHNFSPFEAATYIHTYITSQFSYQDNEENPYQPRSLIGILNSKDIVCVGYAKFTKAIIDKLNMPGLEAFTFESAMRPLPPVDKVKIPYKYPLKGFGHYQNIIKINDPKYGIKGNYVSDACWDAKNEEFPDGKGYGNFMYPISDLLTLNSHSFIEVDKYDQFDLTNKLKLTTEYQKPKNTPIFKEFAKDSKPIPIEKLRESVFAIYRKMFPASRKNEINEVVEDLMTISEKVASSLFNKKAKNSLARIGHEKCLETVNTSEIMK